MQHILITETLKYFPKCIGQHKNCPTPHPPMVLLKKIYMCINLIFSVSHMD